MTKAMWKNLSFLNTALVYCHDIRSLHWFHLPDPCISWTRWILEYIFTYFWNYWETERFSAVSDSMSSNILASLRFMSRAKGILAGSLSPVHSACQVTVALWWSGRLCITRDWGHFPWLTNNPREIGPSINVIRSISTWEFLDISIVPLI